MVCHGLRACAFTFHCLGVCSPFPSGGECSDLPGFALQTVLPFKDTVQETMAGEAVGKCCFCPVAPFGAEVC